MFPHVTEKPFVSPLPDRNVPYSNDMTLLLRYVFARYNTARMLSFSIRAVVFFAMFWLMVCLVSGDALGHVVLDVVIVEDVVFTVTPVGTKECSGNLGSILRHLFSLSIRND